METIYLDHNATTPISSTVLEVYKESLSFCGNASSLHSYGRKAKELIETSRQSIASVLDIPDDHIIFTSTGTEANNLAIKGFLNTHPHVNLFISSIEHPSIYNLTHDAIHLPVDENGVILLNELDQALAHSKSSTNLVSIMMANYETGVVQPILEIANIAKKYNAIVHVDAVQAFGKIAFSFADLGIDMMTISSHKIGGPLGISMLVAKPSLSLIPQMIGGRQERTLRAGTENVPAIVAFSKAIELALHANWKETEKLRDYMEKAIQSASSDVHIFSQKVKRIPNTSCIAMPFVDNETQVMYFDLNGFMVSQGAACHSGKKYRSHVLKAMNIPNDVASTAIRISLGLTTTFEEVDAFTKIWSLCYTKRQKNKR